MAGSNVPLTPEDGIPLHIFDPYPPDANGVRDMSEAQWRSLDGRYVCEFYTAGQLPAGALVYGRMVMPPVGIMGYFVLTKVEEGG